MPLVVEDAGGGIGVVDEAPRHRSMSFVSAWDVRTRLYHGACYIISGYGSHNAPDNDDVREPACFRRA